jgi:hypothetical protein
MRIVVKPMGFVLLTVLSMSMLAYQSFTKRFMARQTPQASVKSPANSTRTTSIKIGETPTVAPTAPVGEVPEGAYAIQNKRSGLYLGLKDPSKNPEKEAHVDQDKFAKRPDRMWVLIRRSDGTYNIKNKGTDFWLDSANGSHGAGDYIRIWWPVAPETNDAQMWRLLPQPDGAFLIENVRSGRVLEIRKGAKSAGALVYQAERTGSDAQRFMLVRLAE